MKTEDTMALAEKRALVARVAASELFQKAPRLREFLLYAADCTLENRLSEVREQVIAERVFSRRPDFQGTQDSIVRAEARNLRKRLESYFAGEGRGETIIVSMPKGGYALAFEPRPASTGLELYTPPLIEPSPAPVAAPISELAPLPDLLPNPTASPRWKRMAWPIGAACLLLATLIIGFAVGYFDGQWRVEKQLGAAPATLPFSALFAQDRTTIVVTSDTGFLQIASVEGHPLSLDDYIARSYPDVPGLMPRDLIRNWNLDEYTDGREMSIAGLILRAHPQFAGRVLLRSGHNITLDELKTHAAVLIGSPVSNPWAQLYEDHLNFRCVFDHSGRILFQATGKQSTVTDYPSQDDIQHGRTYARLAFLPGSNDTPAVLLIAGTTAQSTEAAGELVADPVRFARALRSIGINPTGPPRFFELLLRSTVFVEGCTAPEIAAWRLNPAAEK